MLTREHIDQFLQDAPNDDKWLVRKVACIISVHGCLRSCELHSIQWEDLQLSAMNIVITLYRAKSVGPRMATNFVIPLGAAYDLVVLYTKAFNAFASFALHIY